MRFPARKVGIRQKDQVADYLESYATHFDLPVRTSTRVDWLEARPDGGYLLTVEGETLGRHLLGEQRTQRNDHPRTLSLAPSSRIGESGGQSGT